VRVELGVAVGVTVGVKVIAGVGVENNSCGEHAVKKIAIRTKKYLTQESSSEIWSWRVIPG